MESDLRASGPVGYDDVFPLVDAVDAIRTAVEQASSCGAITDEEAADLIARADEVAAQPARISPAHELHRFAQSTKLGRWICRFPGCFHPPAASTSTGKGGARNTYCAVVRDEAGGPKHTAVRSMRLKKWLDRDGSSRDLVVSAVDDDTLERPISLARMAIPAQVQRFVDVAEELTRQITSTTAGLRQQVALLGDDEARQAEMESVQLGARREVEAAETTRLSAETRAREAVRRAEQAERDQVEAEDAAEEAIARAEDAERTANEQAEHDRQAVAAAEQATEQARSAAADEIARIQKEAADAIAAAHREAEARIVTAAQETQQRADEEVRAIREEADNRIAAADAKTEAAESAARTSDEAAQASRADAEQARREAVSAAAAAETVQDANRALTQERDQLLRRIEADTESHRQDLQAANRRAEKAETRLDEERGRHQTELERLAAERATADARATSQQNALVAAHGSQVEALETRIRLLERRPPSDTQPSPDAGN